MIAVDIGGSHITSVEILDSKSSAKAGKVRRAKIKIDGCSANDILNDWATHINLSIDYSKQFDENIAIAFPGPFDYKNGIIEPHPNGKFKPLEGINIKKELKNRLRKCNLIHFENDAACFGLGEYHYGQKQNDSKVIAITIGSGIGTSFIDKGEIIKTRKDVPKGGEVYYLPFLNQTADDYFSTRWFINEALKANLVIEGVKELIEIDNTDFKKHIFNNFAQNFSKFFSPIAHNFQAETLIIGGNIAKSWEYFGHILIDSFAALEIGVKHSKLGEKAICLGAAKSLLNALSK